MRMTILSMRLSSDTDPVGVPIFLSEEGKTLKVRSGYVDLSDLFTTIRCLDDEGAVVTLADGDTCECGLDASNRPIQKVLVDPATEEVFEEPSCPSVQEGQAAGVAATAVDQLGTYTKLSVRLASKALVKGCVTGNFMYSVSDAADDKSHTFCTQTAKSPYAAGADDFDNGDFEFSAGDESPELMDFPLDSQSAEFATRETIDLTFPIAGGVTIDGGKAPQITLGIDLGRVLRFRGLFDDHPREDGFELTEGSHFFSLPPQTYQFVFVGKPGRIIAHQWTAQAGLVDDADDVPEDRACVPAEQDGGECQLLAGWMTTIFQGDGSPIAVNLLPDDDDAFTVLKGSNFGMNGFDTSVFGEVADDVFDVTYGVSSPGTQGLTGILYGVDFGVAVAESQDVTFATKTMTNGKFSFGGVQLLRKL
jgi:hypothetical protein